MEFEIKLEKPIQGWIFLKGQLIFNKFPCNLTVELKFINGIVKKRRLPCTLRGIINFILKTNKPLIQLTIKSTDPFKVHYFKVRKITFLEALYRAYRRILPIFIYQNYANRDLRKRLNLKIWDYFFKPFNSYYKITFGRIRRICGEISISKWLEHHNQVLNKLSKALPKGKDLPYFNVLVLFENENEDLKMTEKSLYSQNYSNFYLFKIQLKDIFNFNYENNLKGEFTLILYAGDTLHPYALLLLSNFIKIYSKIYQKNIDLCYFDSYYADIESGKLNIFLKPDFNLEYFKHYNYILNAFVIKTSIFLDFIKNNISYIDFLSYKAIIHLIYNHKSNSILHLHLVLMKHGMLSYIKEQFLKTEPKTQKFYKLEFLKKPLVSIIIPTKDNISILKKCLESIIKKTTYTNYEIILVDNKSEEKETYNLYEKLRNLKKVRILESDIEYFNFSSLVNYGISQAKGDIICLLNNDTEIITPNWIEEMLYYALKPEIGVVGAKLFYPDGSIQHAGVNVGLWGLADHIFKGDFDKDDYMYRLNVPQEYLAVTAACMMFRKEIFYEVGRFDETLAVNFNDLDFCLRVYERGYKIIFTPFAKLLHYEHKSRGKPLSPEKNKQLSLEKKIIIDRWKKYIDYDPYFNLNFSINSTKLSLDFSGRCLKYYLKILSFMAENNKFTASSKDNLSVSSIRSGDSGSS